MVQICGLVQSPQLNGLRGQILSHTDDDRWIVMLQDGQRYFLTRSNIQTLSPPPADHIYPASANTPASTPNIINTDDSTPKPSAYKVVERPARDDDTINETLHEQEMIWAVKESRASLKHEQNNTPDKPQAQHMNLHHQTH